MRIFRNKEKDKIIINAGINYYIASRVLAELFINKLISESDWYYLSKSLIINSYEISSFGNLRGISMMHDMMKEANSVQGFSCFVERIKSIMNKKNNN